MWVVKGKTIAGKEVQYKISAGKDTEKAFVMAQAFQEHGKASPDDDLTAEVEVLWSSDNVMTLPTPISLRARENYGVEKRIKKGVWERHSARAYRTSESASEALESAASEYPNDQFRIVKTVTTSQVVIVSKNALPIVGEVPDKPEEGKIEGQTEIEVKAEVKAQTPAKATGSTAPKPKPASKSNAA